MSQVAGARRSLPLTDLSEDERLFREQVRQFAEETVRPLVSRMDQEARIPRELIDQCFEVIGPGFLLRFCNRTRDQPSCQKHQDDREHVARRSQDSSHPPSTSTVVPVTKSFWMTNRMACATSSAVPARGIRFLAVCLR